MHVAHVLLGALCFFVSQHRADGQCTPGEPLPGLGIGCPIDLLDVEVTYAVPDDCSNYISCFNGCGTLRTCGRNTLYSEPYGYCDAASQVRLQPAIMSQ